MSEPITEGWDGQRLYVRVYGREPSAERLRRMKDLWRRYEQAEDRERLWQRRERLENKIIPSLDRRIKRKERMIRQASREIARRTDDEGGWVGDRLKGRPEEGLLEERDELQEQHARRVAELSVLVAYLDSEPEQGQEAGELDEDGEQPVEDHAGVDDGGQSEFRGDDYAEWVGDHIEKATSLSHAYALALASDREGFDPDKAEQYRGKEYKSEREGVRQAWRRSGYLDTGPYTPQKLKHLKRRVKRYASEGIPPQRPEN